jgi:hypothetical protein
MYLSSARLSFSFLMWTKAYNAFTRYGQSSGWCKSHALSFRAMSRAMSIRSQLKKYMQRFNLPLESCQGDAKRLRRCLVSGYWRNGARWMADGTYRSVRGNKVCMYAGSVCMSNRRCRFCMCTPRRYCSPESLGRVGSFFTKWRKRRRPSKSMCNA